MKVNVNGGTLVAQIIAIKVGLRLAQILMSLLVLELAPPPPPTRFLGVTKALETRFFNHFIGVGWIFTAAHGVAGAVLGITGIGGGIVGSHVPGTLVTQASRCQGSSLDS